MDLEVEVVGRPFGVAGVAHEPDDLACLHVRAVRRGRRERGQVRVVELVALAVEDPQPVAADLVPADREDGPVRAGDERLAELPEDVVAVVVGHVRARGPVAVDVRGGAVDGEHVAARRQLRMELERLRRRLLAASVRAEVRCVADARLLHGRRSRVGRRRRDGRRGRGRGLHGGLGVADLHLAAGDEPAVIGGQTDVELGDEAAVAVDACRGALVDALRPDRQLPPGAERDLRRVRDGLALDLQVRDGAAVRVAARSRVARAGGGARGDAVRGDLARKERQRGDDALRLGGRMRCHRRRRAGRGGLRGDDRPVGGIRERRARGGRRGGRRDDRRRGGAGGAGHRHLDRPGGRGGAGCRRGPLGARGSEREQREREKQENATAGHRHLILPGPRDS
jgi:hypothetical protein